MSDFLGDMNEEALPVVDEADLVYGAKLPPMPEGTYAVKSTLGNGGLKYDEAKKSYTIHAVNRIVKPLRIFDPKVARQVDGSEVENAEKIFFNPDGSGKAINDFFRISASNRPGVSKAMQFLKYAGDPDYNKSRKPSELAQAVADVLKLEPSNIKLSGRWRASIDTGEVGADGKKIYENKSGARNFPPRADGGVSHVIELAGEQVAAQFDVTEYGELTEKDAR